MKEVFTALAAGLFLWLIWSTLTLFIDVFRYNPHRRTVGNFVFILGLLGTYFSLAVDFENTKALLGIAFFIGLIWWINNGFPK